MKWLDGEGPIEAGVLAACGLAATLAAGMLIDRLALLAEPIVVVSLLLALALLGLALRHALHRRLALALLCALLGPLGFVAVFALFAFVGMRRALGGM
jgi:hypothetical protein